MTARGKGKTIEVCQKAFMNVYGITEKRVRLQREKLIDRLRNRSPPPLSPIHHYVSILIFKLQLKKSTIHHSIKRIRLQVTAYSVYS